MEGLGKLAQLIRTNNNVGQEISKVVGRPALMSHVGEYIAAEAFDIKLEQSAAHVAFDGRFKGGPLATMSVNIKWFAKRENTLDMIPGSLPDYYLVLAGPKGPSVSSRNTERPWLITSVFLFRAAELESALKRRGVKIGTATSVADALWQEAEIYPRQLNLALPLSPEQRSLLKLFGQQNDPSPVN